MTAEHAYRRPDLLPDGQLATAAVYDRVAFAAVYDRYSRALYDFCLGMARDPDAAADCVRDTFVTAATRLGRLREPEKLRTWLYAVARHEALRRLRRRDRRPPADAAPDRGGDGPGPDVIAARTELADLVAHAAGGLSDHDRAVLELHYRHGLDGPELADALGVSQTMANTRVGRVRATVERCLGALLLARHARAGQVSCSELTGLLAQWDGTVTAPWRRRIARHLDRCPDCDRARHVLVAPRALLGVVPLVLPAPLWLRGHALAASTHAEPGATRAEPGATHVETGADARGSWWPPSDHTPPPRRTRAITIATVAAAACVVAAVVAWLLVPTGTAVAGPAPAVPAAPTVTVTASPRTVAAAPRTVAGPRQTVTRTVTAAPRTVTVTAPPSAPETSATTVTVVVPAPGGDTPGATGPG